MLSNLFKGANLEYSSGSREVYPSMSGIIKWLEIILFLPLEIYPSLNKNFIKPFSPQKVPHEFLISKYSLPDSSP